MDTDASPGVEAVVGAGGAAEEVIEDPRVLAAIERLADLDGLPIAEQVEVFADVHARLTEALGTENVVPAPSDTGAGTGPSTGANTDASTGAVSGQVPPGGTPS